MDRLERHLLEVSDPKHRRYGKHLSVAEVHELMKPANDTFTLVHEWLADNDIHPSRLNYSPAKDWINMKLPVSTVERMLDAEYFVFKHEHGHQVVRAPKWSLPIHLHNHVDVIQPTTSFMKHHSSISTSFSGTSKDKRRNVYPANFPQPSTSHAGKIMQACGGSAVTSLCLRTLYGTADYMPSSMSGNLIGMANYGGEASNISDINLYMRQYRPDAYETLRRGSYIKFESVNGGENLQRQRSKQDLSLKKGQTGDLVAQTILGITSLKPLTVYSTAGISPWYQPDQAHPYNLNEPFLKWALYVIAQPLPPSVIVTAYSDDEQTVPINYARRVCGDFMALGARGVSMIFSSGDNGVGQSSYCSSNDGNQSPEFVPMFPASCPWVTTVGATKCFFPESVAGDGNSGLASGGGFSKYFIQPQFQKAAIAAYLQRLGNEHEGMFNPEGRGYPDISAQGMGIASIWNGQELIEDGTAAAAATAGAIFALVNDARLRNGLGVLGFLNPLLYTGLGNSFNDVIKGSTTGCGGRGFSASVGWDPASGWGTPNFPKICYVVTNSSVCGYVP
ncbi:tripeptidyl peptidase-like protein [Calycina marina]|uniref:tripeptidyl-peptidase II n=1 Tax=Calycina marina TaxID=1763456 RepID=A0A9P7Z0B0_9HELO|nr:tripeptidyl peptidase-like protein [Calycina marina]